MKRRKFLQQSAAITGALSSIGRRDAIATADTNSRTDKKAKRGSANILFIMTCPPILPVHPSWTK